MTKTSMFFDSFSLRFPSYKKGKLIKYIINCLVHDNNKKYKFSPNISSAFDSNKIDVYIHSMYCHQYLSRLIDYDFFDNIIMQRSY
jgi:hypothetical protein